MTRTRLQDCHAVLSKTPLFEGVDEEAFLHMMDCWHGTVRDYGAKETIVQPGAHLGFLTILVSGRTQTLQEDYLGVRTIMKTSHPGEVLGLVNTRSADYDSLYSVVSSEECTVLFMDFERVRTPCANPCPFHTHMLVNLVDVMIMGHMRMYDHLVDLSKRTTRDKLMSYLTSRSKHARSQTFTVRLSRQELADYLCVDRSAMCTELGRMQRDGLIDFKGNSFTLLTGTSRIPAIEM